LIYTRKENNFRIEDGQLTFKGERLDPYGFWQVTGMNGKTKLKFEGEYTSCDDALKAVHQRIADLAPKEVQK
jgi:hypothetical protein